MAKKYFLLIIPAISLVFLGFLIASAQSGDPFDKLTYPIPELGNCKNKADCGNFCDKPENMKICVNFAEERSLMPEEDIKMAKKMIEAGETSGPGGCKGQQECAAYCDDINNMEECLAFAEKNGMLPADELAEGKKVLQAMKQGLTPPSCKSKKECDSFCRQPENMEQCLAFGEAAGIIPPEELKEAKMALEAMKKGAKMPSCGNKAECEEYCGLPENLEECITFAEAAGFMTADEASMVRKTGGKGPGGCRGQDQCEAYCEDPANAEECINFALEAGMMSPEEAEKAKKAMAAGLLGGPGDCKGQEECEAYCNDFTHQQECMDFAVANGFMTAEEAEQAKAMMSAGFSAGPGGCIGKDECEAFCNDPANLEVCIQFAKDTGMMSPEEADQALQGGGMMQQGGPGGCQGPEECMAYCEDPSHLEECAAFVGEIKGGEGFEGPPPGFEPSEGYHPEGEGEEFGPVGPPDGFEFPEGFEPPEDMGPGTEFGRPPTEEEMKAIEEQYRQEEEKRRMEEEYRRQYEEQYRQSSPPPGTGSEYGPPPEGSPPPEGIPQSLLRNAQNFLANVMLIFRFR